ncbi:DUF5681 domain-containing protein [Parasphingorhabdus sp.]|jgi:hypothetical protein|uniref:DUF5681 domain-containing protein n=1 Tax=Parasphingorhabdus sp. TaxID=2709688 RepID=UPI0039E3DCAD
MTHDRKTNGQFAPGKSGNPNGRKKGSRNSSTILAQGLFDGEADAIIRKAIELAKAGDPVALRLCVERLLPPRKDRPVEIELPDIGKASDLTAVISAITKAVGEGEITPAEGSALSGMLETQRRTIETGELAERLEAIESRLEGGK